MCYHLNTVTYKIIAATFLPTRCLLQVVKANTTCVSLALTWIKDNLNTIQNNDILSGADNLLTASHLPKQLVQIIKKAFLTYENCEQTIHNYFFLGRSCKFKFETTKTDTIKLLRL